MTVLSDATNSIPSALSSFLTEGYIADNPPALQNLSLTAYRLLAEGNTVDFAKLASASDLTETEAERLLRLVPESAYDREPDGSLSAFVGLSTKPTMHEFTLGSRTLYTWCVFDALFLPAILGEPATLTTSCPTTGRQINVTITATCITQTNRPDAVMSILAPDMEACCADLRGAFCNQVNFFADKSALVNWHKHTDAVLCVPLDVAFTLAMQRNEARFPDISLDTDGN